mmetsp:Transcript_15165/g.59358  ORF Transcript_15165/g.59358 Transcript_15165/m.59358 type:complete len:310 (-) Transcript_15165:300-1229(-)
MDFSHSVVSSELLGRLAFARPTEHDVVGISGVQQAEAVAELVDEHSVKARFVPLVPVVEEDVYQLVLRLRRCCPRENAARAVDPAPRQMDTRCRIGIQAALRHRSDREVDTSLGLPELEGFRRDGDGESGRVARGQLDVNEHFLRAGLDCLDNREDAQTLAIAALLQHQLDRLGAEDAVGKHLTSSTPTSLRHSRIATRSMRSFRRSAPASGLLRSPRVGPTDQWAISTTISSSSGPASSASNFVSSWRSSSATALPARMSVTSRANCNPPRLLQIGALDAVLLCDEEERHGASVVFVLLVCSNVGTSF